MRTKYDKQLTALHDELIAMGALCEAAIQYAVQALRTRDTELAKRTMQGDKEIDQKERIIESACLKLLLEQQPVARSTPRRCSWTPSRQRLRACAAWSW